MSQTVSWFIETEGKLQRVEETLVGISDKELSFTRNNEKYILKSNASLASYVFGDVVFATQKSSGFLAPIRLPFVAEEPVLSQDELDEIVKSQVQDLENRVMEAREVIKKLLTDKPETMNLQYRIFDQLAEFRQFLQQKAGEVVLEKLEQEKQLLDQKQAGEILPTNQTPINPGAPTVLPGAQINTKPPNSSPPVPPTSPVESTGQSQTTPAAAPASSNPVSQPTAYKVETSTFRNYFTKGGKK